MLDRRHATTHWLYRDELRQRFPRAKITQDEIYLRDGRVWTSAGITAGIDLMLALVEEDLGPGMAGSATAPRRGATPARGNDTATEDGRATRRRR